MTDPNSAYKSAYAHLSQSLGRPPTLAEQFPLMEQLRQAWIEQGPAAETPSPHRRAREARKGEALSGPGRTAIEPGGGSAADGGDGAESNCERATVGGPLDVYGHRGPNGGVIAECVECRQLWERPAKRGRPSSACPECRI